MKMLLDHAGMLQLSFGQETSDHCRHYLANAPARAIVVFENDLRVGPVIDWLRPQVLTRFMATL